MFSSLDLQIQARPVKNWPGGNPICRSLHVISYNLSPLGYWDVHSEIVCLQLLALSRHRLEEDMVEISAGMDYVNIIP